MSAKWATHTDSLQSISLLAGWICSVLDSIRSPLSKTPALSLYAHNTSESATSKNGTNRYISPGRKQSDKARGIPIRTCGFYSAGRDGPRIHFA